MAAKNLPGSLQTTRQMLDELDALMERMLTLPVTGAEEPSPRAKAEHARPEASKIESAPRTPTVAASLTLIDEPVPESQAHSPMPLAATPNYELPATENRSLTVVDSEMTPHWLKPIIWTNDAYDFSTQLFGPLGAALRSGIFRTTLGVVGAGLLLWALAWLIRDLIGWLP